MNLENIIGKTIEFLQSKNIELSENEFSDFGDFLKKYEISQKIFCQKINIFIQMQKLDEKRRDRKLAEQRYYLFSILREHKLGLKEIGSMFNRDHSTVIHGLKMHDLLMSINSKEYLQTIIDVQVQLDNIEIFELN
jgi:chromosomal replication initiation ATPase DnaA